MVYCLSTKATFMLMVKSEAVPLFNHHITLVDTEHGERALYT